MAEPERLSSTGQELQDELAAAIGDPIAEELGELRPEHLLLLLQHRDQNRMREFLRDHHVPARHADMIAAKRALPYVRRDRGLRRLSSLQWLMFRLGLRVHHALVTAVGPTDAQARHRSENLDELVSEYGAPAVRLAVLADWGSPHNELDLAMLIADGRVVPERWKPHLDRLGPIAARIVEEFPHGGPDTTEDDEPNGGFGDDAEYDARAGDAEVAVTQVGVPELAPAERGGPAARGELPVDMGREPSVPQSSVSQGPLTGLETGSLGSHEGPEIADTLDDDTYAATERAAITALEAFEAAEIRLIDTLDALRVLRLSGTHRLLALEPTGTGTVDQDELAALRAFLSEASDQDGAFLAALERLLDLAPNGANDDDVIAAEALVWSFPAAQRFRTTVLAAGRGRIRIAPSRPIDPRLIPWLEERSSEDAAVGLRQLVSPVRPAGLVQPASPKQLAREQPPEERQAVRPATVEQGAPNRSVGSSNVAGAAASDDVRLAEAEARSDGEPAALLQTGLATSLEGESVAREHASASLETEAGVEPSSDAEGDEATGQRTTDESASKATGLKSSETLLNEREGGSCQDVSVQDDGASSRARAGEDGSAEDTPGLPAEPDLEAQYGEMFAACRWGLAHWLAITTGNKARANALEAIACADGARSATGPLALALADRLPAFPPQRLSGDRPLQLLAVAAATRAALVAPFTGVAATLSELARVFEEDAPGIAKLAEAAAEAAQQGVAFTGDVIASLGGVAAVEAAIAEEVREAEWMLTRTGRTAFTRADHIWSEWVATGGPVHQLLSNLKDGPARARSVRDAVLELGKESVQLQALRASDDHFRGPGKAPIEGSAKGVLLRRLRDALAIASRWLSFQAVPRGQHVNEHETAVATRVREVVRAQRELVQSALQRWAVSPDLALAGAAQGGSRIYAATFALVEGEALPGDEQDLAALLNVDLLRTNIVLGDDLAPLDPMSISPAQVLGAQHRTFDEALRSRCEAEDHVATGAIVSAVATSDPVRAEALRVEREEALARARARIAEKASTSRSALQAARRAGRVNEDTATSLDASIDHAEEEHRLDLGAASRELDDVALALEQAADAALEAFRGRLDAELEGSVVRTERSRFDELLAEGDIATAEELLLQLLDGTPPPSEHLPTLDFASFFPSVVDHLVGGITPKLIECAERREVDGPLDFSALSPDAAETAASALKAWRGVAVGERQRTTAGALAPALHVLGLEFKGERPAQLPSSNERTWVDLSGVERVPETLVPVFGSYAGDSQRVLLVWKQPGESLLDWVEQDPSERSVLVLYFGTMPTEVRQRVVNRLRGRQARPVAIVDDAVLAFAASLGRQTFEVTMRATLPFTGVNPYEPDIAGLVPEEMFYGRVVERSEITSETGTSLIYGGRRLGKSALLRAAARRFDSTPGWTAAYVDLSAAGIRNSRRAEAVWDLVAARLVGLGVAERPSSKRTPGHPYERTEQAVRNWLGVSEGRRLLLLLDECDDFFDIDAESDFAETRRLKDLMESTGRRFKVVFAGLHQVTRFASYPNQPLAHLGKPLPIGPLAPQPAHNLIAKPLTALGWRFESENLINRVLTYCNYIPILLQVFGHSLVQHLYIQQVGAGEPPQTITAEHIDAVLASPSLEHAVRDRFDLTLSLDPRYKMIVYVLAFESQSDRFSAASVSTSTGRLRDECRAWWPDGFSGVNDDEFKALLEELVGLGVLSLDHGEWRMRSPNVRLLLGNSQAIEQGLYDLVAENPPVGGLFSGEARRLLPSPDGTGDEVRSPLSELQLADVIGEGRNQLRVVVGSAACGADHVGDALAAAARSLHGRWDLVRPQKASVFENALVSVPARQHQVVFSDLRGVTEDGIERSIAAVAKPPVNPGATRSAVLLVDPASLLLVLPVLAGVGLEDADIVLLRRHNSHSLRAWAVEVESGFIVDDVRKRLAEVTGGWPVLVDEAERTARREGARRAIKSIESSLPERAEQLLGQVGLFDGPLATAYATVLDVLGADSGPAEVVATFLDAPPDEAAATLQALVATGVLLNDDGLVSIEPIIATAWRQRVATTNQERDG
jgi:hypothetical protein